MVKEINLDNTADFLLRSKELRDDVRMLGFLLGDTIKRFEGERIFEYVERFRALFKRIHRQADDSARHEVEALLNELDLDAASKVIRRFSLISTLSISLSKIIVCAGRLKEKRRGAFVSTKIRSPH
jgi:phosphoenolpyruvate carboxylase